MRYGLAIVCVASALAACGGASTRGAETAGAQKSSGASNVPIGELASAQGGLASLGGNGNRESSPPAAVANTFHADLLEKGAPVKVDGVLGEWPARMPAKHAIRGAAEGTSFAAALQYDDAKLYIAGEVADASFVRTSSFAESEDHASLLLAFPSGGSLVAYEIGLFAGKEGEFPGEVKFLAGGRGEVPGAKIIEAPASGGYTFEASIPWSAFPEARTVRVGLRGAARYYDADKGAMKAIVATGPGDAASPTTLPWLPTEPEQSLIEGLLIPKRLPETPRAELLADVAGDAMKERIAVYDRFFTICGPAYRGGKEFFFRDLGAELLKLDHRDVTGRPKDDLLVRRRFNVPGTSATREWFEVWSILKSDEPVTTFAHEIAVASGGKQVANAVHIGGREIEVTTEPASGWDAASYREPVSTDVEPVLLPWGSVKSQTFRFDGSKFVKAKEVAQAPAPGAPPRSSDAPAPADVRPAEPPTPAVKHNTLTAQQMLEQYKQDKGLPSDQKPRVNLEVHVDGDARPERVVLMGKDLVIFGPGFRGGTSYATITLSQFGDAADIKDLTARDLTGDGAADLIVRGTRRMTATGSAEPVELEAMFIYEVKQGQIARVFAIETAREQGQRRVQGLVQFVPARGGKTFDIDVRPGVAKGWTAKTYPWQQEQPGGALEPLLLPWGGVASLRYTWNGTQFTSTGRSPSP